MRIGKIYGRYAIFWPVILLMSLIRMAFALDNRRSAARGGHRHCVRMQARAPICRDTRHAMPKVAS